MPRPACFAEISAFARLRPTTEPVENLGYVTEGLAIQIPRSKSDRGILRVG
jgi:hypothetical protein